MGRDDGTGQIAFSTEDDFGSPSSGSAIVTIIVATTAANGGDVTSECVEVTPGGTYGAYARYYMASGQPGGDAAAMAWMTFEAYSDDDCAVAEAGISGGPEGDKDVRSTYSW